MSQLGNGGVAYRTHYGLPETFEEAEYPEQKSFQADGCTVIICTKMPMTEDESTKIWNAARKHLMTDRRKDITTFTVLY